MSRTSHLCPVCKVGLFVGQSSDVSMLGCGRCGGQWLDNAGTQRVVAGIISAHARTMAKRVSAGAQPAAATHYRDAGSEPAARACPLCQQPLEVKNVAEVNIEIDVCGTHGTWFDAHELDALAKHFEFKAAVSDAEAAMEIESIDRATALEHQAGARRGLLGYLLGS